MNKERERERLATLKKILGEAEKKLDCCEKIAGVRYSVDEIEYYKKLIDIKKAIDTPYVSEMEKKSKFRRNLYRGLAAKFEFACGLMAFISGFLGVLFLVTSIRDGVANLICAFAWLSVMVGLILAGEIADAASEVM